MSSASPSVRVTDDDSDFAIREQNKQLVQEVANIKEECARMATILAAALQTIDSLTVLLTKSQQRGDVSPLTYPTLVKPLPPK